MGRGNLLDLEWIVEGNKAVGEDGHFRGPGQWPLTDWHSVCTWFTLPFP